MIIIWIWENNQVVKKRKVIKKQKMGEAIDFTIPHTNCQMEMMDIAIINTNFLEEKVSDMSNSEEKLEMLKYEEQEKNYISTRMRECLIMKEDMVEFMSIYLILLLSLH